MSHCRCSICQGQRSSFNALRRRNPDDLETLEKIAEARKIYREGVSINEIAHRVRAHKKTINKWIADLKPEVDPRIEQARKLYQQGVSISEISRRLRADRKNVKKWIEDIDLPVDSRIEEARRLYQEGVKISEISRRLPAARQTIKKWIADLIPEEDPRIEEARRLYQEEDVNKSEISRRLRTHPRSIRKWVADLIKPVDPRIEQAKELYRQGVYKIQIIKLLRVSRPLLNIWLADLLPQKRNLRRRNPDDLERLEKIAKARRLYQEGVSRLQIKKQLHVDWKTLTKWLADLVPDVDPRIEQAKKLYQEGFSVKNITKQVRADRKTVKRWLADLIPDVDPRIEQAKKLYQEGATIKQIIAQVHADRLTVNKWLADIPKRKMWGRWLKEDDDYLKQHYVSSSKETIMSRFPGRKWTTIKVHARGLGLIRSHVKKIRAEKRERARKLYSEGWEQKDIVAEIKVSPPTVHSYIKDLIEKKKKLRTTSDLPWMDAVDQILAQGYAAQTAARMFCKQYGCKVNTARYYFYKKTVPPLKMQQALIDFAQSFDEIDDYLRRVNPKNRSNMRRRNPDDLERLEKIAEARTLYQQGAGIVHLMRKFKKDHSTITKWVADLKSDVDPRIEQAREFYKQGVSIDEIRRRVRAGHQVISKWVADLKPDVDPRIEQARELYKQGVRVTEIQRRVRAATSTVKKWIEDLNPPQDPRKGEAIKLFQQGYHKTAIRKKLRASRRSVESWLAGESSEDPRKQKARELYQRGNNLTKIKNTVHASMHTVREWVADLLPPEVTPTEKAARRREARELYQDGLSFRAIAKHLGVAAPTAKNWATSKRLF